MAQDSKARDLYQQKKTLQRQLETLEQDQIQPFIMDLYKTLPPEWREMLAREEIFPRIFELGKASMLLRDGSSEQKWKYGRLQTLLAEHVDVVFERKYGLTELTFILDPDAVQR